MKKYLSLLFSLVLVLVLAACGGGKEEKNDMKKLVVGASPVPHAEILEAAKPLLEKKGIELEIKEFTDYVLPNQALEGKDLDANFFQHIPYLELEKKEKGYDFVNAGGVHIEPIGIYSKKYKSLDELPNKAKVIMSSSVADHGRILSLLEAQGLITLKEGIDKTAATLDDIVENPKNLQIDTEYAPEMLPQIYNNNEGDIVVINSNFAIDAGLNPTKDPIAIESGENNPYVNIVAVRKGDENRKEIKALIEVLHSKEIQDYIKKNFKGIIPVSK